ncbi:hypothetical protein [Niabella aquatica]
MKFVAPFFLIAFTAANCVAQTLGDFKPKDQSYGLNKVKNANRIYIASFTVNYQVYNEKEDFKQGGRMLGGGYKGDALASLSVGLENITEAGIQEVTDRLFGDFTSMLKAKGLEIVPAEEAGKTGTYSGYTKVTGGKINEAQFPGTLATTPTGFEYYVKNISASGKEKSGGFLGNTNTIYGKLSNQLNDAIIADVDLFILFVKDKDALDLAGANIKVKTSLRLADTEAIIMKSDAKLKLKGQNKAVAATSQAGFYHGKVPTGLGVNSSYIGGLKSPLDIEGVIEDKKLQSFAGSRRDFVGVATTYGTWYNPDNVVSKNTTVIPVDEKKYTEGAYMAGKKFIEYHTAEFLKEIK